MTTRIVTAGLDHLDLLVPLFDNYRFFYGCRSDQENARKFLSERLTHGESIVLLAIDETRDMHDSGVGFVQLYPSFSSIAMRRTCGF